jgi:hypothetical protein
MIVEMYPSHDMLVDRAVRWLGGTGRCACVLRECSCWALADGETPDALGYLPDGTAILVECKATRADFLKDRRKPSRSGMHNGRPCGLGNLRYYMTPPRLVRPDEVPEGWGLLEAGKVVRRIRSATRRESVGDVALLVAELRRQTLAASRALAAPRSNGAIVVLRPDEVPGTQGELFAVAEVSR